MSYTLTYNTATVITTPVINSTKVTVFSNVACYANINNNATTISPIMVLPNRKNDINMQGLLNTLSLLPVGGATAAITITQIGNVFPSGTATAVAGGGTGNIYTNG